MRFLQAGLVVLLLWAVLLLLFGRPTDGTTDEAGAAPAGSGAAPKLRGARGAAPPGRHPRDAAPALAVAREAPPATLAARIVDRDGSPLGLGDISERIVAARLPAPEGVAADDLPRSLREGRSLCESLLSDDDLARRLVWEGPAGRKALAWNRTTRRYEATVPGDWQGTVGIEVLGQWWHRQQAAAGDVVDLVIDTAAWATDRAALDLRIVVDHDGAVLSSQWVRLRHLETGAFATTRWDPEPGDDVLPLGGLLPGHYDIVATSSVRMASDAAHLPAWQGEAPGPYPAVAGRIRLYAGQRRAHTLRYPLPGRIRARFLDAHGRPVRYGLTSIPFVTSTGLRLDLGTSSWDVPDNATGTCMLEDVPPGRGFVIHGGRSHAVEVASGRISDLVLRASEPSPVVVRCRVPDERSRPRRVWLIDRHGVAFPAGVYTESPARTGAVSDHAFAVADGPHDILVRFVDGASERHAAPPARLAVDADGEPVRLLDVVVGE